MAGNAGYAYDYLRRRGLSPAQAAGVVGAMSGESGPELSTTAVNPTSGATGAAQWLGSRKTALMSRPHPNAIKTQMDYLWSELQGPESQAYKAIQGAHTIEDATNAWMRSFERPSSSEMASSIGGRVANARKFFNQFSGRSVGSVPAPNGASVPVAGIASVPGSAAGAPDDKLSTLAAVFQRLDAATPKIAYNSPLSRTDDPAAGPTQFGGAPQSSLQPQSNFQPTQVDVKTPNLGDLLSSIAASRSGGSTTAPSAPTAGSGDVQGGGLTQPQGKAKGTAKFEHATVAGWIAPILQYAREHGWKGQVNSGFRSFADQTRIYNSGVRPAAKPGTSNHEGAEFPRGAVDVSNAEQLAEILRRSKYAKLLVWAGGKDPVHFSHPHGGSY